MSSIYVYNTFIGVLEKCACILCNFFLVACLYIPFLVCFHERDHLNACTYAVSTNYITVSLFISPQSFATPSFISYLALYILHGLVNARW